MTTATAPTTVALYSGIASGLMWARAGVLADLDRALINADINDDTHTWTVNLTPNGVTELLTSVHVYLERGNLFDAPTTDAARALLDGWNL